MTSYKKMILKNTLTICLLFSVFFTVTFYIERYTSTKKEYLKDAQQNLDEIMDTLNSVSFQIQDLPMMFHSNPDFKDFVENDYVSPYLRRTITEYIRFSVASLSSTDGTIAVTRPSNNYIITSNSTMSLNYFYYTYGISDELIQNALNPSDRLSSSTPHILFSSAGNKNYFTIMLVDNSTFSKPYIIFTMYDLSEFMGRINTDATILISNGDTPIWSSKPIPERDLEKLLANKKVFKYSTVAKSTKMYNYLGTLTYTLIIPKWRYVQDINRHVLFTGLSFLILFLLSILISQKMLDKTYSPIQRLVNQISNIDSLTLENEIDAISSAISALSKRNKALSNMVASNQSELKEKFVNDLLHGYLTDEQVSYGIKAYLKDSDSMLPLAIVIIEFNQDISELTIENDVNASSLNLVISSLFGDEFENENFFHFSILSPTTYCAVVSCDDIEKLRSRLQRLLLTIENDLGLGMYSSISNYVDSWEELQSAFLSTYFAHSNIKSREISKTVYSRDEIDIPILYSYEIDNDIFSHCLRCEKDKLEKSLDFLIKENFTLNTDFQERQSQMSVLIFALCMRILASIKSESSDIFGKDYNIYLELRSCQTVEDFRKLLSFIFGNIIDHIEKSQSLHEQDYANSMLNFIHQNYNRDISLLDLAGYMNMSQSYVSRLFKKLMNYNFKDYLAKIRIEQAERLFSEYPEKTISEVSSMVGFNTVKPFSQMFLKLTGMTPSEYKRIHGK